MKPKSDNSDPNAEYQSKSDDKESSNLVSSANPSKERSAISVKSAKSQDRKSCPSDPDDPNERLLRQLLQEETQKDDEEEEKVIDTRLANNNYKPSNINKEAA